MPLDAEDTIVRGMRYWLAPSILAIVLAVTAWVGLNVTAHVWADHQLAHAHQTQLQEVIRWINTRINGGTVGLPSAAQAAPKTPSAPDLPEEK